MTHWGASVDDCTHRGTVTLAIGGDSEKFAKGRHCEDIAGGLGMTIGGNDWGERRKKSKLMHGGQSLYTLWWRLSEILIILDAGLDAGGLITVY